METMLGEQRKVRMDTVNEDRISNLPLGLMNLILSYLPMRDVVRTSILSARWRYKWATITSLRFGNECHSTSCWGLSNPLYFYIDEEYWSKTLACIIDGVLILHSGSIQVFEVNDICAINEIDRWIVHVSRKSIRELVLIISGMQPYKMPSSLYMCESLVKLHLSNCVLRTPPFFKGFKSLEHLRLSLVTLTDDALENLISSCPLKNLSLWGIAGLENVRIDAPNFSYIEIQKCNFKKITFGNRLVKLLVISVGLKDDLGVKECAESLLIQIFNSFPGVQQFEARNYFLRYLASGNIPDSLPAPCLALCRLSLGIQFNDVDKCLAALCLIRSAPNLKVLQVQTRFDKKGRDEEMLGIWMMDNNNESHFSLNRLQVFKIEEVVGYKRELEFIKFVLLSSPVLEEATVKINDDPEMDPKLPRRLLRLRRASPRAEIIFDSLSYSDIDSDS